MNLANAAHWLQRLELMYPCSGRRRAYTPLFFSDAAFTPMLQSTVDTYLLHLLRLHVPPARLAGYSFHSFRIGFACALLAGAAVGVAAIHHEGTERARAEYGAGVVHTGRADDVLGKDSGRPSRDVGDQQAEVVPLVL
jgi:hypothetical protein